MQCALDLIIKFYYFPTAQQTILLHYTGVQDKLYCRIRKFRGLMIQRIMRVFHDFLFLRLEVAAKISLLSNSLTCALNRTHGGQDGGMRKTEMEVLTVFHVLKNLTCKLNFADFNFAVQPRS